MAYDIIGQCSIRSCAAPAAAAATLRRFLVSAALVLLSLSRSALILFALAIDTIRGGPGCSATSRCSPRRAVIACISTLCRGTIGGSKA